MLILYMRPWCPYCMKVQFAIRNLALTVEERNIGDNVIAHELIERGGKQQVPYLVDTERGVEMYESEDIMAYLKAHASELSTL